MTADEIRAELQAAIRSDKRAAAILRKIAAGRASFTDTMNYSLISGKLTGQQLSALILELSEGREELAEALLHDRYEDINAQCAAVQTSLDEKNGLHLAPQKAPFPADRAAKFVHSLVDPTVKDETIKRRARNVSENITVTFHDDFIAENAEFRDRAGIECFVERITDGSCCPWCNKVAGRYRMQDQPGGLFSRHDNCGCTIIYDGQVLRGQIGENGRRGRRWVEQPPKVEYQKPTVLSRSEAEKLQAELLPRRLTGGENGGIINYARAIDSFFYADDYEYQTYTKEEIIEHLESSPVGLDTLRYLEKNPQVKVKLTEDREESNRGQHDKNLLTIWLNNCPNVRVAAQTVVHEVAHHKYNIGGSQLAETICFAFEKMHKEGRNYVTREEWDTLAEIARKHYWDLPAKGGVDHLERFDFIVKKR